MESSKVVPQELDGALYIRATVGSQNSEDLIDEYLDWNLTMPELDGGNMEPYDGERNIEPYDGRDDMNNDVDTSNYREVWDLTNHIPRRTYELPFRWYFLVFKPFNNTYNDHLEFYRKKGSDHCRKKIGKMACYVWTKEIIAPKEHINFLCSSDRPLDILLHDKKTNRYMIYAQKCNHVFKTYEYIIKESKVRNFKEYLDFGYFPKI